MIQRTYKLPLIGPLIALSSAILRLPRIVRSLQSLESYQHLRNAEFVAAMRQITQTVNDNERALASQVGLLLAHEQAQRWWRQHSNQRAATVERQIVDAANSFAVLDAMARSVGTAQVAQRDDIAQIQAKLETGNVSAATLERLAQIEADFRARNDNADARLAELQNRVTESAMQTDQRVAAAIVQANGYAEDSIAALHVTLASRMTDLESAGTSLSQRLAATLEGIEPRLAALESHHHASRFDALYFAFERRFRGSREDIRKRVSYYLPLLHDSVVGRQGAAVLDIGCGRGEWLELLRDEKLTARGIDTNADMARECQQRGLDVAVGDAMAHLKALPDNALGALTGFHVIEHLALDTLIELIEQAHRVVQPGGLVIFETPNPENVVVGSCNFYTDPTHQRPLPPALTQFLVEAGGFVDVQIHRVNADVLPQLVEDAGENDSPAVKAAVKLLRSAYQCAPDYSVIGQVA